MIEFPEAIVLSKQLNETIRGKQVEHGTRNQSPHKFAFTGRYTDLEFTSIVSGTTIGHASSFGSLICLEVVPDYILILGDGGEKIIYHQHSYTLPKRHQLLLEFDTGDYLSVSISGWGSVRLIEVTELEDFLLDRYKQSKLIPLTPEFTLSQFQKTIRQLPGQKKYSAKKIFYLRSRYCWYRKWSHSGYFLSQWYSSQA